MGAERLQFTGLMNRRLRRRLIVMHEQMDELFRILCDTEQQAATAMGELWGSGAFDCGPQDYDFIVTRCLEAAGNVSRTQPIA